jgi:hypothetical protein
VTLAPTRRVNRGRGHSYFLDGESADGVTWILDHGVPKPALVGWAANCTADYATDHWQELAELRPSQRNAVLRRARWDETDKAARRGSEVHDYAQRLAAGEEVEPPEELIGHVDAYLRFVLEWQPVELVVEATVGNRRRRYMGTLDLIAQLADGQVWLLDWKTGGKDIYREAALQLAAYRNAEFMLEPDGAEKPMPKVDACGCVWLRADGYDLIPVDTDGDAFRTFLYAQQVARFVDAPAELVIGAALEPPERSAA